jgi:hypothetical protein
MDESWISVKNEYQQYLINFLSKPLLKKYENMYKDFKKSYNKTKKMRFYYFQEYLEIISSFEEEEKNEIVSFILDDIECDYFEDLLIVVFSNTAQILSANFKGKYTQDIDITIPNIKQFIYNCFLETGRSIYYNPKNIENKENMFSIIDISIKNVIKKYLPMKSILDKFLHNSNVNKDEEENVEEKPEEEENIEEEPVEEENVEEDKKEEENVEENVEEENVEEDKKEEENVEEENVEEENVEEEKEEPEEEKENIEEPEEKPEEEKENIEEPIIFKNDNITDIITDIPEPEFIIEKKPIENNIQIKDDIKKIDIDYNILSEDMKDIIVNKMENTSSELKKNDLKFIKLLDRDIKKDNINFIF